MERVLCPFTIEMKVHSLHNGYRHGMSILQGLLASGQMDWTEQTLAVPECILTSNF